MKFAPAINSCKSKVAHKIQSRKDMFLLQRGFHMWLASVEHDKSFAIHFAVVSPQTWSSSTTKLIYHKAETYNQFGISSYEF